MSATVTLPATLQCPQCAHPTTVQIDAPVLALTLELHCPGCQQRWAAAIDQRGCWTTSAATAGGRAATSA